MSAAEQQGRVRHRVVYTGRVQGVCFRAISCELARGRAVVGYVRNLPDGTVELEAEGAPEEVGGYLRAVEARFAGYITGAERSTLAPRGDETRFQIRY